MQGCLPRNRWILLTRRLKVNHRRAGHFPGAQPTESLPGGFEGESLYLGFDWHLWGDGEKLLAADILSIMKDVLDDEIKALNTPAISNK